MKTLFCFFCILICEQQLAAQQEWEKYMKIFDVRTGEECKISDLVAAMEDVDVLFFGEEHDDSIAHQIQAVLFENLLEVYKDVTLSLEMFERDVQLVMDEYLADHITEAKLREEGRAWKNYDDYSPMVNLAKSKGQLVVAANVPTRYANLVSRKGLDALKDLPKESKRYLPSLPIFTYHPFYEKKFNEAMGGHGHGMGPTIFHAQLLRDATMAESVFETWRKNKKTKILHLNGRFHSDEYLGTVAELKRRRKRMDILTISCFSSEDFDAPEWDEHAGLGNFVILTDPTVSKSF
ncbi:ChaN family lipoprotein [Lunatibacter salilacus]|uniref:ChaN family lipoprotein n=1 Tax=Lunatibacter salilacus TaxID=2483804 RepID=UPI00131B2744|nr:ChaN family lipoprotein [Lunatibacter salilacus]